MNNDPKCVRCGFCCTVAPCSYGKWNPAKKQCAFLSPTNECLKYGEIVDFEEEDQSMFGTGCSSSLFNTVREEKIRSMKCTVSS